MSIATKLMLTGALIAVLGCDSNPRIPDRGSHKEPAALDSTENIKKPDLMDPEAPDEWGNYRDIDRTNDERFWGGYEKGVVYETTRELLYDGYDLGTIFYWPLNESGRRKIEFSEYDRDPTRFAGVTRIPSGTQFEITLIREVRRTTFHAVWVTATFMDGPSNGSEFDVMLISNFKQSNELPYKLPLPSADKVRKSNRTD